MGEQEAGEGEGEGRAAGVGEGRVGEMPATVESSQAEDWAVNWEENGW